MKKGLALFLALIMVMALFAGCGAAKEEPAAEPAVEEVKEEPAAEPAEEEAKEEPAAEEDYSDITVAWISPIIADEFYAYAKQGLEDCAAEYGFTPYWTGTNDVTNEKMIEAGELCIADGIDAIATVPLSESAWTPFLQKCKDLGIPVAAAACEVSEDMVVGFVGTDIYAVGYRQAEEAHKAVGSDELYIGIMMSNLDATNQLIQLDAIQAYLDEKGIKGGILDKRECQGDAFRALEATSNMLQAYPEMNVILCLDGASGPQAAASVGDLGRDVVVIGMDDSALTKEAIANGTQYASMAQNCYKWGYYSTKMAFLAAVGRLDEMESLHIDSGVVLLTKDNLDTYSDELYIMP